MYRTVEELATDIMDDDRTSFTFAEADELAETLGVLTAQVIRDLKAYGLTYDGRTTERKVRGFTTNSHDRWNGNPCSGGSGWEQVTGFAGQEG